ncbi:MAG: ABC transporter permease [Xanthobacteraceae bacterium]
MTAIDRPIGSLPALSRFRRLNFLLIVCVSIGLWLVLVPIAGLLLTAFTEDTGLGFGAFTLDNFIEAYSSDRMFALIGNSLIYAAGTALVTFVIGGLVAWAVERTDAPGGTLFHNLALVSFAIPGLLMAMAWIFVLSPNIGWINAVLKSACGLKSAPFNIYSMGGMIWTLSSHYFPLAYLVLGPALRTLDVRMEEAGLVSGARYWQVLPRITLPLLRPAILSSLLLLFIMGLSSYEVPRIIGLPARIDVFTTRIQDATTETPPEFGVASALSLTLLAVCLVAVYFYRRATRNAEAFATITGKSYMPTRITLGRWRWPVSAAIMLVFLITLGLPLFTLSWQSFFSNLSQPFMHSSPQATLANYAYILRYPIFLDAVRTSVVVSAMAATAVVALTLVMAWIVRRSDSRFAWLLDALASAPIAIPSVIIGASILFTYLVIPIGVYDTIWILLIAYVTLALPYGMRFASSGMTQIHRELEEAAEVSGARVAQVLWRVVLPLLLPFLLAAWIYVFVLSVRELGASIFLIGPGTNVLATISLTMWEEGGSYGAVAALGILQIAPLLLIVAGLRFLETRVRRRTWLGGATAAAAD